MHAEMLSESDLRAIVNLAPGRVVVSSIKHIEVLATAVEHRAQGVFVHVIDVNAPALAVADGRYSLQGGFRLDSTGLDRAIEAIINNARLDLVGLYCDVGASEHDFVSYPAAIGHIISEMTHIRRQHGVVLTLLGLGGGRTVPPVTGRSRCPDSPAKSTNRWTMRAPRCAIRVPSSFFLQARQSEQQAA